MAIHHAASGERIDIRPLDKEFATSKTLTLLKTKDMEVIRLVVPKGKDIATHSVAGEITVQCIEGRVTISASGENRDLVPGTMLYLNAGEPHSVRAHENSSLLVTILLH